MINQRKVDVITAYNQQASSRNSSEIEIWKEKERAHFLALLQEEGKQTLLEIGAGHGRDSLFFQNQGVDVAAIDLSPAMVALCQQKGISTQVMDMTALAFPSQSFDAVYALNSFLHLSKQEFPAVLENVHRVLQSGGLFYLGLYGGVDFEGIWENDAYTPKRFFSFHTDEQLKQILADWFKIIYFQNIPAVGGTMDFQSVILKKPI